MSLTAEQISEAALSLPSDARALLADRLVRSLDLSDESDMHQLWAEEALRRCDEVRDGSVKTIPGDVAMDRMRRLAR